MTSNEIYVDRIMTTLRQRITPESVTTLMEAIEKDKAFISGSFLLECIAGGFKSHDIDIFVPTDGVEVKKWLVSRSHFHRGIPEYYKRNLFGPGVDVWVWNGSVQGTEVQAILVNLPPKALHEAVFTMFDFDFCKNTLSIVDGRPVLKIFDINSVTQRRSGICNFWRAVDTEIERTVMYRQRGFAINWSKADMVRALLDERRELYRAPESYTRHASSVDRWPEQFVTNRFYTMRRLGSALLRGNRVFFSDPCALLDTAANRGSAACCALQEINVDHIHIVGLPALKLNNLVVIRLASQEQTWRFIVDTVLALFPLVLPTYILWWILEWLPNVHSDLVDGWLKERKCLEFICSVNEKFRHARALRQAEQNKASCL